MPRSPLPGQWTEGWPQYESGVYDQVYYVADSDADADANAGEDSGREMFDLSAVAALPGAQQTEQIYWAY
eukprot:926531-Lingulodinium_polyedra.AAC.1